MIRYEEALAKLLSVELSLGLEPLPLSEAIGRVIAEDIRAPAAAPLFDASAMDGYALRAEETTTASRERPLWLRVIGRTFAGDAPVELESGTAIYITTGAPMPRGADAVVRIEHVEAADSEIVLNAPIARGADVRRAGEDYEHGALVLRAGSVIDPAAVLALASLGIAAVTVRRRPRVALLTTGNELRSPGVALTTSGAIYDANGPALRALIELAGAQVVSSECVEDTTDALVGAIARARAADVIVSVGGVSEGARDLVPAVAASVGARTLFHKVAIRPGKPIFAATLDRSVWLGLPGNPISAIVGARFFLCPVLRHALGRPAEEARSHALDAPVAKPGSLRVFLRARVGTDGAVRVLAEQASHLSRSLVAANAWVVTDGPSSLAAGDEVSVFPRFDVVSGGES